MSETIQQLMAFLDDSLTSYQAVDNIQKELMQEGFTALCENKIWQLEKGKSYYVVRNDSAVIAFRVPECGLHEVQGYHVYAVHSDSPAFKVKENPEIEKEGIYVSVNTERYGQMLLSTWFDRPLTIAGRACVDEENRIASYPVRLKDNTCLIPSLAIHMNREANNGVAFSAQNDMLPLLTMVGQRNKEISSEKSSKNKLQDMLAEALSQQNGCKYCAADILSYDLFVENCEKAVLAGAQDEFIMTPRYDDLACAFAGLKGIVHGKSAQYINVFVVFDNEEVGSRTRQGAGSTFFRDTLENIADGLGVSAGMHRAWKADSFLVSADNGHACHPNQGGKADPTNRPYLNKGIVLKYHGGQQYATDAYSAAYVKKLCGKHDIPLQAYANHSDIPGGATLGNIMMTQASMAAADIGLPQLAMHSAYETGGVADIEHMIRFARLYFSE